jgi:hypothetical protein
MKEEAPLGNPFIGELGAGRAAIHVAKAPPFYSKGTMAELRREIVEGKGGKEGEGGRSATILWPIGHAWPPLNPYFHSVLHLAPIMLTPLTESIKSKANSFHFFQSFIYLILLKFSDFILCNDQINML